MPISPHHPSLCPHGAHSGGEKSTKKKLFFVIKLSYFVLLPKPCHHFRFMPTFALAVSQHSTFISSFFCYMFILTYGHFFLESELHMCPSLVDSHHYELCYILMAGFKYLVRQYTPTMIEWTIGA